LLSDQFILLYIPILEHRFLAKGHLSPGVRNQHKCKSVTFTLINAYPLIHQFLKGNYLTSNSHIPNRGTAVIFIQARPRIIKGHVKEMVLLTYIATNLGNTAVLPVLPMEAALSM
jgi:hypothetical protein